MKKIIEKKSFSYLLVLASISLLFSLVTFKLIGGEVNFEEELNEPSFSSEKLESLNKKVLEYREEDEVEGYEVSPRKQALPLNSQENEEEEQSFQPQTVVVEDTPITEEQRKRNKINKILQRVQQNTNDEATKQLNLQRIGHEEKLISTIDEAFNQKKEKPAVSQPQQTVKPQKSSNQEVSDYEKEISEAQRDAVINSIQEEISTLSNKLSEKPSRSYTNYLNSKHYIGGLFNFYTTYPQVLNVDFRWSGGLSVGLRLDDPGFILEGNFIYSDYYLDDRRGFSEVKQYNSELFLKYSIFPEKRVRPYGGVGLSYTVRKYYNIRSPSFSRNIDSQAHTTSRAIDMGVQAGVDIFVQRRMSLGIEYRYYYNINHESDSDSVFIDFFGINRNSLEKQSYSMVSAVMRLNF